MIAAIDTRLKDGKADPVADANAAAQRGEFQLIVRGDAPGLTCFTARNTEENDFPFFRDHDVKVDLEADAQAMRWRQYATAYNQTLVDHSDYPDADVCRPSVRGEPWVQRNGRVDTPARSTTGPVRSLHEAARRGDAEGIRRFLGSAGVNTFDSFGMTPLEWAVARSNDAAIVALVTAGADPWLSNDGWKQNAIFWAASFGQEAAFKHLAKLPGCTWEKWPANYLNAALSGGSKPIIEHILSEPHEKFRLEMQTEPLPSPDLLQLLGDELSMAQLLIEGALGHPDLLKYALANGASPNDKLMYSSDTPLGRVANGLNSTSVEIVDILLKAGADPNRLSRVDRPVWLAIDTFKLDGKRNEKEQRAAQIIDLLIAAGADINLPNDQGVPSAWLLFFPYRYDHRKLDASFVTPDLIEMLVSKGLDLNAVWEGERLLPLVEKQAGFDSELAAALRRLGARS